MKDNTEVINNLKYGDRIIMSCDIDDYIEENEVIKVTNEEIWLKGERITGKFSKEYLINSEFRVEVR